MKLQGTHALPVARTVVWGSLLDAELLSAAVPGCRELRKVRDHVYEGTLLIGIGALRGTFSGVVEFTELEVAAGCNVSMTGKRGPSEFVSGSGRLWLDDGSDLATMLNYDVDVRTGGRLAAVGDRLLAATATTLVRRSLVSFEAKLVERHGAIEGPEGADR